MKGSCGLFYDVSDFTSEKCMPICFLFYGMSLVKVGILLGPAYTLIFPGSGNLSPSSNLNSQVCIN